MSFSSLDVDGLFASDLFPPLPWEEASMATNEEVARLNERQTAEAARVDGLTVQVSELKIGMAKMRKSLLISHISMAIVVAVLGAMIGMSSFDVGFKSFK